MTGMEAVLKAVCQGARYAPQIADAAGLKESDARTYLKRLIQRDRIKVERERDRAAYVLKDMGCLLAEFWKGAA